jgi:predicted metal-dependent phosphoesterase TrpH
MGTTARTQASYDLHLHTYWSYDATAEPAYYLQHAAALGMRCLAITEHHNLDSQGDVFAAAAAYPQVRILRAAELTVNTSIGAVDLVCLGFPEVLPDTLQRLLDRYHQWQREYGAAVCRGMQALGFDYTDQDRVALLGAYRPAQTLAVQGTTHVRNQVQRSYFLHRGFIRTQEEYAPLIDRVRREHGSPPYPPVEEVSPVVHAAGALVSIAHPKEDFGGADRKRMDTLRDECQLDGIECAHTRVPPELTPIYRQYCLEHRLLSTAGSDCHTREDIDNTLGRHGGQEAWLDELLERLAK